ncbi:MAG: radical SAM protein [Desulfovibrio sp.]|nr:radical SAM protein [Desulfovibrio sp.]
MTSHSRSMPWPRRHRRLIYPLFLPWLGCRSRCVFCAQEIQTGRAAPAGEAQVLALLQACEADLLGRPDKNRRPQLAFYGGTFTALPEPLWRICLDFALRLRKSGLIDGFRCSTRPDCLDAKRLRELKSCGCELVELGIQSFDSEILDCAGRGYSREAAIAACGLIAEAGLGPGVQLMPGLPASAPEHFIADVEQALACNAVCLRFYPCLVLAGSPLARLWQEGKFRPWSLPDTLTALARGWLLASARDVPVIRMGLAPQDGLAASILAGPCHPALGSRVMAQALLLAAQALLDGRPANSPWRLHLPASAQGCRLGWRNELAEHWHRLGPGEIRYWERQEIAASWQEIR